MKGDCMQASAEIRRSLATIRIVLEEMTPEAPLAMNQPSTTEVEEARRAFAVLCRFFEVDPAL
jgi:hypothetical protein